MEGLRLTEEQKAKYSEVLNTFRCELVDILDMLVKDYNETLFEDMFEKAKALKEENKKLLERVTYLENKLREITEELRAKNRNYTLLTTAYEPLQEENKELNKLNTQLRVELNTLSTEYSKLLGNVSSILMDNKEKTIPVRHFETKEE